MNQVSLPDIFYYIGILYLLREGYLIYKLLKTDTTDEFLEMLPENVDIESIIKYQKKILHKEKGHFLAGLLNIIIFIWILVGIAVSPEWELFSFILIISFVLPILIIGISIVYMKKNARRLIEKNGTNPRESLKEMDKDINFPNHMGVLQLIIKSIVVMIILYLHFSQ